jgi:hypothetical protein
MLLKKPVAIEGKKLLGLILLGSALIHFLIIFFLPEHKTQREYQLKALQGGGPGPVSLELEPAPPAEARQPLSPVEELKKEVDPLEEELKKRQQFVDTSAEATDEEVKTETEKVGEKGTLAKDTTPGGSDDLPRLEGTSESPSLGSAPGVVPGPPAPPGGESTSIAVPTEESPQAETQDVQPQEAPEGENKPEKVAEAGPEAVPTPQEQPTPEPPTQEPKLAEVKEPEPVKEPELEIPEGPEVATQAKGTETPPPVEDKSAPLTDEAEKIAREGQPQTERTLQADKGEDQVEKELEKLEVREDGLITIPKKRPQELAHVPPWELRGKTKEATRPKGGTTATPSKGKPRVAISFNAKTLSGGDIVVMPPMNSAEANAPGEGQPSFSVKKDAYAPYYKHIRDRISWYWYLGYGTRQEIKLETENNQPIIVEFKIYPEGVVKEVKIVQEAGNHLLASRIKDSIEATRLQEFSRYNVEEEYIDVRFNFYFF